MTRGRNRGRRVTMGDRHEVLQRRILNWRRGSNASERAARAQGYKSERHDELASRSERCKCALSTAERK